MRIILSIALFVVVAFVGGIAFLLLNLDSFVKEVVEEVGSEVTQVSVTLDDTNIDPANGQASMSGLIIANPAGFKSDHAVSLGGISVKMDPTTVTGDVIVINEIVVDTPSVIYEVGDNGTNIDTIRENVMAFANQFQSEAGAESSGGSTESSSSSSGEEGPKVIIENVYVKNIKTAVNLSILADQTLEAPALDVHLTDIGKKEGGVLAQEAAIQIVDNLFNDIVANVANSAAGNMVKDVLNGVDLDAVGENLGNAGEVIEKTLGDTELPVEDIANEADKALQNLFGTGN